MIAIPPRTFSRPVLACLIAGLLALTGCNQAGSPPETLAVKINDQTFHFELALDKESQFRGLSGRTHIAADGGMLFAFSDARVRNFVMRECLVPIDIAFLDATGRVTATHAMQVEDPQGTVPEARLTLYSSDYPAMFALEFKGGTLQGLALKRGDLIKLPIPDLKGWTQ